MLATSIFLLLAAVSAEPPPVIKTNNINIKQGDKVSIESPGYPDITPTGSKINWNLSTGKETNILLVCEDIRISPSQDCKLGYLNVFDGDTEKKYCGTEMGLTIRSIEHEMKLELDVNWSSGVVKCHVIGIGKDEVLKKKEKKKKKKNKEQIPQTPGNVDLVQYVNLKLNGPAYDKINFFNIPKGTELKYKFETSPDAQITLFCTRVFLGYNCNEGYMNTTGGTKTSPTCGHIQNELIDRSTSNVLELTISEIKRSDGWADCLVQAVNGPNIHQFKNVASVEVDSSEYGQTLGVKKTDCDCGWSRRSSGRIVNGEDVEEGQYPWAVSIQYGTMQWCGGSIITEYHVVTAAHCVVGKNIDDCRVLTGTINNTYTKDGQILRAEKFIANDYDPSKLHLNDIALIYLKDKITFSNKVGRICLSPNRIIPNNQIITVMGWGSLGPQENMRSPQIMKRAHVRIVDYNTCSFLWYRMLDTSKPDRVCVWDSKSTACFADSGGPLVWLDPETNRYTLAALVSFGRGKCETSVPQVNTDPSQFYDWIQNAIQNTKPSSTCKKID
uniref:Venom S1 protease with CUB domain 15 n=1 Tax=Oncocephalus sp. TaxID=2944721 RepID=A0AB38ZEV6_9HEMI